MHAIFSTINASAGTKVTIAYSTAKDGYLFAQTRIFFYAV
jgi:hypothetical protein